MKKTAHLNVMIEPEIKQKLFQKAKDLGLTLTGYLEKIAREPVCFLDVNVRSLLEALNLKT